MRMIFNSADGRRFCFDIQRPRSDFKFTSNRSLQVANSYIFYADAGREESKFAIFPPAGAAGSEMFFERVRRDAIREADR